MIDYSRIYQDIVTKIVPRFPRLKQSTIGYDPAFATDLATQLRDRAGLKVAEVLQNYPHLSEPAQVFEALVKAGRVAHGGHRVLRHHVENVAIKSDDAAPDPAGASRRPAASGSTASSRRSWRSRCWRPRPAPAPTYEVFVFGGRP